MVIRIHPVRYGSSDLVLTELFRHLPLVVSIRSYYSLAEPTKYYSCHLTSHHYTISMAKVMVKSEAAKERKKRCRKNHRRKVRAIICRPPLFCLLALSLPHQVYQSAAVRRTAIIGGD